MEFIKKIVICVIFLCASISNAAEFEVMDMLTVNGITHLKSSATIIVPDTVPSSIWISTSATTSHLYISTAGKVGIGTNSPSAKLTINTSIGNALLAMNDVGGTPAIYAYNSSIGAYGIRAEAVGTGTKYGIYGRATGGGTNQAGLFTASGGTDNWGIYVTAGQSYFDDEVGIGIDAPTHKLHVVGGILATSSITASSFHGDGSNLDGLDFSIGDSYGGGKIFWLDASREHGLISTTEEQSAGLIWGPNSVTAATLSAVYAGKANTSKIVAAYGAGTSAAKLCADYTVTVNDEYYDDWYLPSIYEWSLLNPHYEVVGGFTSGHYYWTSNEKDTNVSYLARVGAGNQIETNKSNPYHVRCIRSDSSIGTSGDNLGHHMASQNIKLNGNWLSNDGGDEGVFVDSAGKVGIGTASPAGGLHIANANLGWSSSNYGTNLILKDAGTARNTAIGIFDSSDANPWAIVNNGGLLKISQMPALGDTTTAPTDRVTIDASGQVGIGTASPGVKLDVVGGIAAKNPSLTYILQMDSAWKMEWDTSAANAGYQWISLVNGESGTGILKLGYLNLGNTLHLMVGGGGATNGNLKVIKIVRASDDVTLISTNLATLSGTINSEIPVHKTINTSSHAGTAAYLQFEDNDSGSGWSWMNLGIGSIFVQ